MQMYVNEIEGWVKQVDLYCPIDEYLVIVNALMQFRDSDENTPEDRTIANRILKTPRSFYTNGEKK